MTTSTKEFSPLITILFGQISRNSAKAAQSKLASIFRFINAACADASEAGSYVLTLQNGLGNIEKVLTQVPREQVLYGCTMTPGDLRGPGHVASHGMAYTPYNSVDGTGLPLALTDALTNGGLTQTTDAMSQVWQKAVFNCAMNATAVLGGGTVRALASFIGQDLAERIAAEVLAVGEVIGVSSDHAAVAKQNRFALTNHQAHKPSMLQDI